MAAMARVALVALVAFAALANGKVRRQKRALCEGREERCAKNEEKEREGEEERRVEL